MPLHQVYLNWSLIETHAVYVGQFLRSHSQDLLVVSVVQDLFEIAVLAGELALSGYPLPLHSPH
eukprot:gene10725-2815_t